MMKQLNKLDQHVRFNVVKNHPYFNSGADRYLKFLPLVGILACDLLKLKTKHKFKEQILIAALAELIRKPVVYAIKHATHHRRPNITFKRNTFPSGHTATAFMCAEIMRSELEESNAILAFSGYSLAALTGIMRLYKNKHWLSDVLAGGVCGFLCAGIACKVMSCFTAKEKKNPVAKETK